MSKETEWLQKDDDDHVIRIETEIHKPINGSHFDLSFKPSEKITFRAILPQVLACISAASFHLPIGLVVAYSAILLDQLEVKNSELPISKTEASWIASLTVLVVPVAALVTGLLVDGIGRINTLKAAALPYVCGWILIATSTNLTGIMIGRVLGGFALAMGTSPASVYITEVARPDLRGTLICLGPAMTSLGMVLVYLAGCFLHWRTVAWINIGFVSVPLLLMFLFAPESPAWLVSRGRNQEALKACKIVSMNKEKETVHQRRVRVLEREHERKSITPAPGVFSTFFAAISKPTAYKPFAILCMCFFFQQMTGIYILIFYAVSFFKEVGTDINPYLLSVIVGVIRMFVGFITSQMLYKFGRRLLCLTSLLSMAVLMFVSGGCALLVKRGELTKDWLFVSVVCLLLYICMSTTGMLSVPWTMTAEMYPLEVRGIMQGFTVCVAHIIMFGAIKSFYALTDLLGGNYGLQLYFGVVSVLGFGMLYVFLPETHCKTLEAIEDYFMHNTVYIKCGKKSVTRQKIPLKTEDPDVPV